MLCKKNPFTTLSKIKMDPDLKIDSSTICCRLIEDTKFKASISWKFHFPWNKFAKEHKEWSVKK